MAATALCTVVFLLVSSTAGQAAAAAHADHPVWPPPRHLDAHGPALRLHPDYRASTTSASRRLTAAINRHAAVIAPAVAASAAHFAAAGTIPRQPVLRQLRLHVATADEYLGLRTRYDYNLTVAPSGDASARCTSIYGCLYALESFAQLVDEAAGSVRHGTVRIVDAPDYAWRGLMLDTGRRFFPMDTVEDILTVMAANKLNVLHLHASDLCRWSVESKLYPNLTAALTGIKAGFYTQEDIKDMIAFAGNLGIRVVPEFDIPGHSKGLAPLAYGKNPGVLFCDEDPSTGIQLYDDPEGVTYSTLHALLGEMAALFTDEVFNIGSDETSAKGRCTVNTSFAIERRVLNAVQQDFKKTPAGWEEVLFDAGAATKETIVDAWSRHTPAEITNTGRKAIESHGFYFTQAAPGGPAGWASLWKDIGAGVPAAQRPLLLGGEASQWTDTYCYVRECEGPGSPQVGARLFGPEADAAFHRSIGGMLWPRGFVAAAAFWHFDNTTDASAPGFVASVYKMNDALRARNLSTCPTNCSCDQVSACGVPYLPPPPPPPPPSAGTGVVMGDCSNATRWSLLLSPSTAAGSSPAAAKIALDVEGWQGAPADGGSLCWGYSGSATECTGCLVLVPCTTAPLFNRTRTGSLVSTATAQCVDLNDTGELGAWQCGGDAQSAQPNQRFAVDSASGLIASLAAGYRSEADWAGKCATAAPTGSTSSPSLTQAGH